MSSYTTNASNELTAIPGVSYTYDSNGNTLTKTVGSDTTTYTWDYENRLTSVTLPSSGGTVSFKYDPYGRRIFKSSSAETSVFVYDGDNLVEETNSSGSVVARYSQAQYIDEPLAMLRSAATSYYEADGLGSITSLSNGAGSLAQTYTFDSFGKQTASSGSLVNPFQYTGRESDPETGLYYYRARYYDPFVGRFIGEDEIGNDDSANLYRYVGNSPADFKDPTGFYKLKGFPPERQNEMNAAIQAAIKKLLETCPGCAGPNGEKIARAIQKATFVYKPDLGPCAESVLIPFFNYVNVGLKAFSPARCCVLPSTIAHEGYHLAVSMFHPDEPGGPYDLEKQCFNCGTGHPPPK